MHVVYIAYSNAGSFYVGGKAIYTIIIMCWCDFSLLLWYLMMGLRCFGIGHLFSGMISKCYRRRAYIHRKGHVFLCTMKDFYCHSFYY